MHVPVKVQTTCLPALSNVFMTFAWCSHLRDLAAKPRWVAALAHWCIAPFEYLVQVPAIRIGCAEASLAQIRILHEAARWPHSCRSDCSA